MDHRINFWKIGDEILGIKLLLLRQHVTAFSKSCAPPKEMWGDGRVSKGHKRAQKINPVGKVSAAQQKGGRTEKQFKNGLQQARNHQSNTAPCACW